MELQKDLMSGVGMKKALVIKREEHNGSKYERSTGTQRAPKDFSIQVAKRPIPSLRPYHPECAQSYLILEAKQGWVWLVLG